MNPKAQQRKGQQNREWRARMELNIEALFEHAEIVSSVLERGFWGRLKWLVLGR